jgi:choline-glycine betaine transporter
MHYRMDGWDYVWMPLLMVLVLLILGVVVYVAVKLGNRPDGKAQ